MIDTRETTIEKGLKGSIVKGSFPELGTEIKKLQKGNILAVITDENVADLYIEKCKEDLESLGFDLRFHIITPGEESKNPNVYVGVIESIAKEGLTRTDGIIALGGGVVGDLAGFIGGTFLRGVNVYQVPTSLLAMVDSSIGGKTGIDLKAGKNLVGVFHMPKLILQNTAFLSTLPEEEFKNGMAEVIKYAILSGEPLISDLTKAARDFSQEKFYPFLERIVDISTDIKFSIVERDEREEGERKLLNLGHTIGHGIESLSKYTVKHGFAVAKGIAGATDLAISRGWCTKETRDRIIELLKLWDFDLEVPYSGKEIYDAIITDKKRQGEELDFIVPREIGNCEIKRIPMAELERFLIDEYGE